MSLLGLPTEILRKIFYNLEWPPTNVALVCRRLRDIAEPILYEEFRGEMPSALEGYMKAIIRRPELAEYVKSFNSPTAQPGLSMTNQQIELPSMTEEQHGRLRNYLQDDIYGKGKCDAWYVSLETRYNYEVVLGFLLNLLSTRVERLVLQTERYRPGGPYVQLVAEAAAKAQEDSTDSHLFSKLRSVHLDDMKYPASSIKMDFVLPYLKLKSVACLSVSGLVEESLGPGWRFDPVVDGERNPPIQWQSDTFQASSIVDLTLTRACMEANAIKEFLGRFVSLQRFRYEHRAAVTVHDHGFVPSVIIAGLEHSKHCLEWAQLERARGNEFLEEIIDKYNPLVSLKGFERLRTLIVGRYALVGRDKRTTVQREPHIPRLRYSLGKCEAALAGLPTTLACLQIEDCRTSVFDFLNVLLSEYELSPLPNLTTMVLKFNGEEKKRIVEALWNEGEWQRRALKKGISLSLSHAFT